MNDQTRKLLEECNSGCKMGIDSMDHISKYVEDQKLGSMIHNYRNEYEKLETKSSKMLESCGKEEKRPPAAAKAFSHFTTDVKLTINNDKTQIAKLLMDGCNMGIQSISECENCNPDASQESKQLAEELVKSEENMMKELKEYL